MTRNWKLLTTTNFEYEFEHYDVVDNQERFICSLYDGTKKDGLLLAASPFLFEALKKVYLCDSFSDLDEAVRQSVVDALNKVQAFTLGD